MTADPRGPPPPGFRWCGAPGCHARLMLRSKHDGCERHRPKKKYAARPRRRSAELLERERRREITAGLAWEGV